MNRILVIGFILLSSFAYSGGFRVSLQGIRQAAMAHTSAHVKDASVLFFNPAGMSFIPERLSITGGLFLAQTKAKYQNTETLYKTRTKDNTNPPFYLGAAYKISDKFSAGMSITVPFGSTVDWHDNWAGADLLRKIELKGIFIQPTVSYKLTDWLSLGGGFIYAHGILKLKRNISNVGGRLVLEDNKAHGTGYNIGTYIRATKDLDVSLAYRSKVTMKTSSSAKASFDIPESLVGSAVFPTKDDFFSAELPLAWELTLGTTYRVNRKWLLSADLNVSGWDSYKHLTFDFEQFQGGNDPNDPSISTAPKHFRNTITFRIGSEYIATDNIAVRVGYYFDQTPVKSEYWSPETPSSNSNAITFGLGYKIGSINIDGFSGFYLGNSRKINNKSVNFYGEASTSAYFAGLGLTWNSNL